MSYDQKPNQGVLFRSTSQNPKAPILSGSLTLEDGSVLRLALWQAAYRDGTAVKDKNGNKFFNIKAEAEGAFVPGAKEDDDDPPF